MTLNKQELITKRPDLKTIIEKIEQEHRVSKIILEEIKESFKDLANSSNLPSNLPQPIWQYTDISFAEKRHQELLAMGKPSNPNLGKIQKLHDSIENKIMNLFFVLRLEIDFVLLLFNKTSKELRASGSAELSPIFTNFVKNYFREEYEDYCVEIKAIIARCINPWLLIRFVRNELKKNHDLSIQNINGEIILKKTLILNMQVEHCSIIKERADGSIDIKFEPETLSEIVAAQEDIYNQIISLIFHKTCRNC